MNLTRFLLVTAACLVVEGTAVSAQPATVAGSQGRDVVHLSGIVPPPASRPAGFVAQAESVLAELARRVDPAGRGLERVVSATVYLTRASDVPALDAVWRKAWPSDPPARTVVIGSLPEPDALLLVSAVAAAPGVARTSVRPPGWPEPPGPYSYAVRAGDALFLSALLPRTAADGAAVTGDIAAQTGAILSNARLVLDAAGLTLADVVHARVYITETADFQAMNAAYRPFFSSAPPTRATVRIGHASSGDLIAIELTAMRGERTILTVPAADGSPGQPNPNYSSAVGVGRWLFTAGMLGVVPGRDLDLAAQSVETLDRLERTIRLAGRSWSDVVECVIWVTDASEADVAVAALRDRTGGRPVVSTVVGTGLVVQGGLVEIMVVTWK